MGIRRRSLSLPDLYPAQAVVKQQIDDFVKYPPRQKAASFNLDTVMAQWGPAMAAEKAKEGKQAAAHHKPNWLE
jgi:hypothetical protein